MNPRAQGTEFRSSSDRELQVWLNQCNVADLEFHPIEGPRWCGWVSLACVARK